MTGGNKAQTDRLLVDKRNGLRAGGGVFSLNASGYWAVFFREFAHGLN